MKHRLRVIHPSALPPSLLPLLWNAAILAGLYDWVRDDVFYVLLVAYVWQLGWTIWRVAQAEYVASSSLGWVEAEEDSESPVEGRKD